jgi:hypothetical protein
MNITMESPEEREAFESMPAHMEVKLEVRDQYGRQTYHPANQNADLFASLAGTKTLTHHAISVIMHLGYTVTYVHKAVGIP